VVVVARPHPRDGPRSCDRRCDRPRVHLSRQDRTARCARPLMGAGKPSRAERVQSD